LGSSIGRSNDQAVRAASHGAPMVDDLEDMPQYSSPRADDRAAARRRCSTPLVARTMSCGNGNAPTA